MPRSLLIRSMNRSTRPGRRAAHGLLPGLRAALIWGVLWSTQPLAAQYISPGEPGRTGATPSRDELRESWEEARWTFGALRLDPWLGMSDGGVVSTVDAERDETDITATFGAGLRAYARTGRRVIWAAHALPEYVWWEDDDTKRSFNGRFGVGLFTYFNRLTIETSVRANQRQSFFSSEIRELTTVRETVARFGVEIELADRLFLTGDHTANDFASRETESPIFGQLDRRLETSRAGLLYRAPGGLSIGGGFETAETEFDPLARNLDFTADGAFFIAGFETSRFTVAANLDLLDREPLGDSQFSRVDDLTGELSARWSWHRSASLFVYGRRRVQAAIRASSSSFIGERFGAGVRFGGRRTPSVDFIAEVGSDDFTARLGAVEPRRDDAFALGVSIAFAVRDFTFRIAALHTELDSTLPEFDREITTLNASLELLGFLQNKLRIGEPDRVW